MQERKIAIVGNGTTTRQSDNFDGEIWTTASVAKILPRVDRVFEVHEIYDTSRLNGYNCPIMMDGNHEDVKNCNDLHIDEMVIEHGPVFQFSFDYMMAYALMNDVKNITLYGIDLTTDGEYGQFRQSFFYWIGFLRGAGITVDISQGSAIFNQRWVYCHERNVVKEASDKLLGAAQKRVEEYEGKEDEARMGIAFSNGYKQCALDLARMGA